MKTAQNQNRKLEFSVGHSTRVLENLIVHYCVFGKLKRHLNPTEGSEISAYKTNHSRAGKCLGHRGICASGSLDHPGLGVSFRKSSTMTSVQTVFCKNHLKLRKVFSTFDNIGTDTHIGTESRENRAEREKILWFEYII